MDLGLKYARVVVVGGSGRIGSAVARCFLLEGARVVICARTASTLKRTARQLPDEVEIGRVGHAVLDITDNDSVRAGVAGAAREMDGIDVLVNAGAAPASAVPAAGMDEAAAVLAAIDGKAMGYLRCARAAIPHLLDARAGRIINVCGQQAHLTQSMSGTVRNTAVAAISKSLADELAGTGVTVNVVHPGPVVDDLADAPPPSIGLPGPTDPTTVAALIAFLASPLAATISGAAIDVGHAVLGVHRA